jgi:hypothetical protein
MIGFDKDKLLLMRGNELSNAHKTFDNQNKCKKCTSKSQKLIPSSGFCACCRLNAAAAFLLILNRQTSANIEIG